MSDGQISEAGVESYQAYIGRSVCETDMVTAHAAARMAATQDRPLMGCELPPMWHYGLFQTSVPTSKLGVDGHPPRGEFMPPVGLPRRMFAGSEVKFRRSLNIGEEVTRVSRIASVEYRRGKTGDLVFVRVSAILSQAGVICIEEEQTIVYRGADAHVAPVTILPCVSLKADEVSKDWTPTTVELFRYSSATFNSHRIHYDQRYAINEECYPGLVVHGPLIATRLCEFAVTIAGRNLACFTFRGQAPTFVDQPIRLIGRITGGAECALRAERADGVVAMSADAVYC